MIADAAAAASASALTRAAARVADVASCRGWSWQAAVSIPQVGSRSFASPLPHFDSTDRSMTSVRKTVYLRA